MPFFCIFAIGFLKGCMSNIRKIIFLLLLSCFAVELMAQGVWRDIYKVKKKDTIYGIAHSYGLTVDELVAANPEMKADDYKLKKGTMVFIPFAKKAEAVGTNATSAPATKMKTKARVGVMLPLHDVDGDGRRMVEYYRGLLIGCDSLRKDGISTDVRAWNVNIDADIRVTLLEDGVKDLDIIFGPLYSKQVKPLADFCKANDIKLVIPFSISSNDVQTNDHVWQVYQNGTQLNDKAVATFMERFKGCNPIFIDCNDTTSQKGAFTFALRKKLEANGISYQVTNLRSSEEKFKNAFVSGKRNVVILNTGRSPELNLAFRKLNELRMTAPGFEISMYGYTEWLQYERVYRELYHKYDVYIPATYYYYKGLSRIASFEQNYKKWFGTTMQEQYIPRFALTGFDQAQFFLRGLYTKGQAFDGTPSQSTYVPLQTPLRFKKVTSDGGYCNNAFQLVHYRSNGLIETIAY